MTKELEYEDLRDYEIRGYRWTTCNLTGELKEVFGVREEDVTHVFEKGKDMYICYNGSKDLEGGELTIYTDDYIYLITECHEYCDIHRVARNPEEYKKWIKTTHTD